jgi:hypothetical protein
MTSFTTGYNAEENRNPDDPLAGIERETLADQLLAQREVLELENHLLRRILFMQPGLSVVTLAGGATQSQPVAEVTLPGDERDAWNGVYVENPSGLAVAVGFNAGGAQGAAGYLVPPNTWKLIPVRYVNLSVGLVDPTQVAAAAARITITRLRVPPMGVASGPLTSTPVALDDTISTAQSISAPVAGAVVASLTGITAGLYRVVVTSYQTGTPDALAGNMRLSAGSPATIVGSLPSTPTPVQTVFERVRVIPNATAVLQLLMVTAISNAGAGAFYFASLAATRIA